MASPLTCRDIERTGSWSISPDSAAVAGQRDVYRFLVDERDVTITFQVI